MVIVFILGHSGVEMLSPRSKEELHVKLQNGSPHDTDDTDTEVNQYCELYDIDTKEVLKVEFPPFYFSTHGLSRPSTPLEEDTER